MTRLGWRVSTVVVAMALASAACDSQVSPYSIPTQCVLSGGVWSCGTGYGSFPDCPATSGPCGETTDAGTCFACPSESAGETCACERNDAGERVWLCVSAGASCVSR